MHSIFSFIRHKSPADISFTCILRSSHVHHNVLLCLFVVLLLFLIFYSSTYEFYYCGHKGVTSTVKFSRPLYFFIQKACITKLPWAICHPDLIQMKKPSLCILYNAILNIKNYLISFMFSKIKSFLMMISNQNNPTTKRKFGITSN